MRLSSRFTHFVSLVRLPTTTSLDPRCYAAHLVAGISFVP